MYPRRENGNARFAVGQILPFVIAEAANGIAGKIPYAVKGVHKSVKRQCLKHQTHGLHPCNLGVAPHDQRIGVVTYMAPFPKYGVAHDLE